MLRVVGQERNLPLGTLFRWAVNGPSSPTSLTSFYTMLSLSLIFLLSSDFLSLPFDESSSSFCALLNLTVFFSLLFLLFDLGFLPLAFIAQELYLAQLGTLFKPGSLYNPSPPQCLPLLCSNSSDLGWSITPFLSPSQIELNYTHVTYTSLVALNTVFHHRWFLCSLLGYIFLKDRGYHGHLCSSSVAHSRCIVNIKIKASPASLEYWAF